MISTHMSVSLRFAEFLFYFLLLMMSLNGMDYNTNKRLAFFSRLVNDTEIAAHCQLGETKMLNLNY